MEKMLSGDLYGEGFYLAGPQRNDPVPHRRQGEAPDPVEEAPHRCSGLRIVHFTAAAMVRVVFTAAWAV